MRTQASTRKRTLFLAQFGILLAAEIIVCFTALGSLPALGPVVATLMMVPVVLTGLLLGTGAGTLMGFFAGLFSFLIWSLMPPNPLFAFVFTPFYTTGDYQGHFGSLLICFVPRILGGTVAGLTCKLMETRFPKKNVLRFALGAALGSLTNTVGVLGGIWLFFGNEYALLAENTILYVIGFLTLTNGIPEAIVAAIVAPAICKPLRHVLAAGER